MEWLAERGITVDASPIDDWVRTFTPRFIEATWAHRAVVGQRWRIDATYLKIAGRQWYLFGAIDEVGQIVDVYLSDRRNAAAARACFAQSLEVSGVTPPPSTTDTATCYPPALRAVLPHAQHRASTYLHTGLERDHHHGYPQGEGRVRPMRRFKQDTRASTVCRGHAVIRNLAQGHACRTVGGAPRVRLATAWTTLAATIKPNTP